MDTSPTPSGSLSSRSTPPDQGWLWIDQRVLEDYDLTATELAVYAAICRVVTDGTGWASRRRLADLAGCRVRAVTAAVRTLEDAGLVDSFPRFGDRGQLPNGYRVADLRGQPPLQDMQGGGADLAGHGVDVESRFHWLAHVGDEDKKDAVHAVARATIDALGAHPDEAQLEDVALVAMAQAYPDADLGQTQRDHILRTLTDRARRWPATVAAIGIAAALGMEPSRVPSIVDGWDAYDPGEYSSDSTADADGAWDERPQTLEEAKAWAEDLGLPARAGAGLWYTAGRRDWECSGRVGRQGETIEDLEAWARAHEDDLITAAP
jgi:hypothetical protein